jgi:hypothetical protein
MWIDLGQVGFGIRHAWVFLSCPVGSFGPSGVCGSVPGYHGRPLCFHGLSLILGFAYLVELGRRPCSLHMRLEGLAGGSCLSPPWRAAGSVKSPASLPQIHQVEGISQVSFPYQGRYSPATRPVTLEDNGDDGGFDGASSDRCTSGSGAVWVFCLASRGLSGVIWTPFERKVFLWDAPGLPLAPPWGLGASGPCVGAAGGLCFSLS